MFKWKDSYNCNIVEIDTQHRKLFEIGNRIYDLASLKDNYDHYDEIMLILDELFQYTQYHFSYEEELMSRYDFKGFEAHKMEHDFFIKKVRKISRKDLDIDQNDTLMEIVKFVADWITGHILESDMGYKDYLKSKGVK
jgi:hemerythrin